MARARRVIDGKITELERELAAIIAEHVEIGYQLGKDGLVNPDTIRVTGAMGAAHMAIHFLKGHMTGHFVVTPE